MKNNKPKFEIVDEFPDQLEILACEELFDFIMEGTMQKDFFELNPDDIGVVEFNNVQISENGGFKKRFEIEVKVIWHDINKQDNHYRGAVLIGFPNGDIRGTPESYIASFIRA